MTKKQVQVVYGVIQALLIGFLFLPVGIVSAGTSSESYISVFGMIRRYAGMGFSNDALIYMIFACTLPVLAVIFLLALKERKNFGTAAWLSAFYTLAAACFFSAARGKMVDSVSMTGLHYLIIFASFVSLLLAILGFFLTAPQNTPGR